MFRAASWMSHAAPSPQCPMARSQPRGPAQCQGTLGVALLQAATCPAQSGLLRPRGQEEGVVTGTPRGLCR